MSWGAYSAPLGPLAGFRGRSRDRGRGKGRKGGPWKDCCCCCRVEPIRHCLYEVTKMSRRDEEIHQTLNPEGSVSPS